MWFDAERQVAVYDLPPDKAARLRGMLPDAKHLSNGYVAVPKSVYNFQVLRYLDLPVPSVMDNYDWPRNVRFIPEPFVAQRVTANFLALHPRAFVLSSMGTGKSMAALWAADFTMRQHLPGSCRCLLVAPLSTLQRVWADAIFQNFLGKRNAVVLYGSAAKRRELLAQPADFYIINFDGVDVIKNELAGRPDIRMVIVDEASAYRDRGTRRHKLARNLLQPKDYFWMMTGTPTPNGPLDAYGMAKLVNNCFGESYVSYQGRVMTQVAKWKWIPKQGAHAEAHRLMRPSIRFAIEDCVDLPPNTVQQRDVELSAEQTKAYKEMKRDLVLQAKQGPITAANEAVLRMKLIQISCGAVYGPNREVTLLDCKPRLSALREVMEGCNEKIIIFAPLRSVVNLLNLELKEYTRAVINGDVPHKERSEIFRAFQQDESPRVIIADPGTMSHGLTLTAASTIIWYAPVDRTEIYLQANKRIDRPGQVHNTTIVQLSATPIEREIFRRLEANESLQNLVLQMVREQ